jgi:hypothetical protein
MSTITRTRPFLANDRVTVALMVAGAWRDLPGRVIESTTEWVTVAVPALKAEYDVDVRTVTLPLDADGTGEQIIHEGDKP